MPLAQNKPDMEEAKEISPSKFKPATYPIISM
jgi:hypothetical protein